MSGELRKPRSIVTVNGSPLQFISWEVNNNGYYQADTFTALFTLKQPHQTIFDANFWAQRGSAIKIMIYDGFPKDVNDYTTANLTLRIMALADSVELDPIRRTVRVTGRDYTSKLIDAIAPPINPNYTASQVAATYAAKYGFHVNVAYTPTKIGTYAGGNYQMVRDGKCAWDILCQLARIEKFNVYVSGNTLNFVPPPANQKTKVLTLDDSQRITTGPAPSISFLHANLTAVFGVSVCVRSYNQKENRTHRAWSTFERAAGVPTPLKGEPQTFYYRIPNLTLAQAQQQADAYLESIIRHESKFSAYDMPGDPELSPFHAVKWIYDGTAFAGTYILESISRRFDFESGYTMSLSGKKVSKGTISHRAPKKAAP